MKKKKIILMSISCALLSSCNQKLIGTDKKTGEIIFLDKSLHSQDISMDDNYRTFYEIFVPSFSDSNGDGIGDLKGIINRIDYLNDGDVNSGKSLGVQGIWLSPIFKSKSYHKYDVTDFYSIDKSFGTEEDLKELIKICHQRNIKLILDLPINHTSNLNEWFTQFSIAHRKNDHSSIYYDYYAYAPFGEEPAGRKFTLLTGTSESYESNFSDDMPELNFDNQAVREETLNIAKYYINLGVDGFRFDAARYIYLNETKKNIDFWNWYLTELRKINKNLYFVGEVWSSDSEVTSFSSTLNCFNFTMGQSGGKIAAAAQNNMNVNEYTKYVENFYKNIKKENSDAMVIPFISNHDMDRAAGYLTLSTYKMFMAANLYLLSTGSPFIYYGEEIGIKGSRGGANTDANRRLAMLWGDSDTVKNPNGSTYSESNQTNGTVKEHIKDEKSLYNHYKKLIMIRNANPEIARGTYQALSFDNYSFGGFVSTYNGSSVAVFHNTGEESVSIDLNKENIAYNFKTIRAYIGKGIATFENGILTLDSQTSVVLK